MEPHADEQPRGTLTLSAIHGDTLIRPWENHSSPGAQIIVEDEPPRELAAGETLTRSLDGEVTILVAGALDLKIASIDGDLTAHHLRGSLTVERVEGDTALDDIGGAVTLGNVQGDVAALRLGDDLTLLSAQGDVILDQIRGAARVDAVHGDANLRNLATVEISSIHGDLRAQETNDMQARNVHGDATIAHLNNCLLGRVDGDLTALDVRESLRVAHISGDARLRDLAARAELPDISGSLAGQDLAGGIIAQASSDAFLETSLNAGQSYQVQAEEIVLRVKSPINAQFVAQCNGGEIRTHLPLTVERHLQHLVGVIGNGAATVTLTSTGGDIFLDAAGAEQSRPEREWTGSHKGFRVNIGHGPNGPHINVDGPFINATAGWPFGGEFHMSSNNPSDFSEMEKRLQDLGERTGRAARKAAEKFREYADRASARARETDWEAVSRDVRSVIERAVGELESTFREIVAEFEGTGSTTGATGSGGSATQTKPAAQRIPIVQEDETPAAATSAASAATNSGLTEDERAAKRRAILEQVRFGDLTLEQADEQLRNL